MKANSLLQFLYETATGRRKFWLPKSRGLAFKLFQLFSHKFKKDRAFIKGRIGNSEIFLPVYHQLAWTINYNKLYSRNLGRINHYISKFATGYVIFDIGANIGDSAFFIREHDKDNVIICVEGNNEYLGLLRENANGLAKVKIIESFVGKGEENEVYGKLVSDGKGTTLIKEDVLGSVIKYTSLNEIIDKSTDNKNIRLIKIDTDGFDCPIIKNGIECIKKYMPVLFFEYAPSCFQNGMDEHADIFTFLLENDYYYFVFYDGSGNYLISCTDRELRVVAKEMHFYFSSGYKSYGDVVAFHKSDETLFNYAVKEEKSFYKDVFRKSYQKHS